MVNCQRIADPVRGLLLASVRLLCLTVVGIVSTATGAPAQTTADLSMTKTDGVASATPGGSVTYTITAINAGPDPVVGAMVTDTFPVTLTATWTCVGAGGGTCTAAGSGNIADLVNLPVGGSVTYTATATISPAATGPLSNTATISSPVSDPDPANNSATDTDTLSVTPIHDIQGPGASSPIVGASVATRGIVTGRQANGFFVQESDAQVDADPATSEGIFVFTLAAPPGEAAVGTLVQVTGTIAEFVPSDDPLAPPSTRITSPTVVQLSTGNPLPTPVLLTPTFPDPAGPFDQLERVEHMRVSVASITVSGPSEGSIAEIDATATNSGRFHGVVTGVARPFREAGIQAPDPPPGGSIPPIPRWDFNPERIRIDSAGLTGQPALSVRSGDVAGPIVGPLDFSTRAYAIQLDDSSTVAIAPGTLATTVSAAAGNEVTIASFNLQRFFDAVDDPAIGEPVLTASALDTRLAKASIAIRQHLRHPDIIAVQEVENLAALQALATAINAAAGPQYAAHLVEGNADTGLDIGFLVKVDDLSGGPPRVAVDAVTQQSGGELLVNPDTSTQRLWEHPPLVLTATITRATGAALPVAVIGAHLRTAQGVDSIQPGSAGWATEGDRVRAIRQRQAESLATLVQARQSADPAEHLVLVGGFEALDVNDGLVDVMNVIAGTPPPDNETAVPGDGVALVTPNLVTLASTLPPAERYSNVPDGNAQAVDHVLLSAPLVAATTARRIEYARIGADYAETDRNSDTTAFRLSDHDPVVAYLAAGSLLVADLAVSVADAPDPVTSGTNLTYTITASNNGPDAAANVSLSDTLPPGTTFVSLTAPGGWSCTTPAVGAGGTISCANVSLSAGSAVFTLTLAVAPSVAHGTVLSNTASVSSSTADPDTADNSATAVTTVAASADLTVVVVDAPDPAIAGGDIAYTVTVVNNGPSPASAVTVTDAVPAGTTFVSASVLTGSGWTTSTPAAGGGGTVVFSKASLAPAESATFQIVVRIPTGTVGGTAVTNTATIASAAADPVPGNNAGTTTTTVDGAPTITAIADQTIAENTSTTALPFTVADVETPAASLTLAGTSSNQALVPDGNVVFGGTGTSRSVTVTPLPDQVGQTTITVTVSDGAASAATSFVLTVTATVRPTYFLAEGATGAFFDEDLLIANPNATDAPVTVTFSVEGGATVTEARTIPARSGMRVPVDALPGLEAASASVQVSSDSGLPLAVERTQFWDATAYGGHTESAFPGPATRWFFAEGAQGYFDTFVLIANPQAAPVDVTLTFLREGAASVTRTVPVAPFARRTIPAASIPELANRAFAVIVEAPQPVVAERAMYFGTSAARLWTGGSAAAGVTAPSPTWYFAEGATGPFFDTFLLLMNPEPVDAQVMLRYLLDTGAVIDVAKVVPARGRLTVNVETESDARLHAASMATQVSADRPIVAERSTYWQTAEGAQPWGESHTSQGTAAAAPRWALAEGRSGGALNFRTYVLLANPGPQPAEVAVQFLADPGAPVVRTYVVPAMSRFTVDVSVEAPELQDRSFITLVATTGDVPIVVERSMYWSGAGVTFSGGSHAVATRLPE